MYCVVSKILCRAIHISVNGRIMTKMASASWNQETKLRLNDKIQLTVTDMGSLVRQVIRGSKSSEVCING